MDEYFLIDTNIIIYFLDDKIPESQVNTLSIIFENSFNISTITNIEVLGWHLLVGTKRTEAEDFLENANIIFIDAQIQQKAIEIKKSNRIKTPDALIAATALVHNLTLVTRNEIDFKYIQGIKIYNPFK